MVGWRIGHWVGRAGLIENKGGVGIDYLTLKNRLQFSAQLWDFNRDALNAQAKITTRYYFSPSVYLIGGWNDFLNTKAHLDSAFIGAGIRWSDNDMKYLAGSIPTPVRRPAVPPRATTVFACQSCGAVSAKWLGRCADCGEWN